MRLGRWERGTEERNGGGAGRKEQLRFGWNENEGGEWNVSGLVGATDGTWEA